MRVGEFFTVSEIECKCGCGFNQIDARTMYVADLVRNRVGYGISPSSACRCAHHNALIGGARGSFHVKGMAIDLPLKSKEDLQDVYNYLDEMFPDSCGIGLYLDDGFIHFDPRETKARWTG